MSSLTSNPLHRRTSWQAWRSLEDRPSVRVSRRGATVPVVRCGGELDASCVGGLVQALSAATDRDTTGVLLDLGEVDFIDCRVLAEIVAAMDRLRGRGATLTIAAGRGQPRRMLELTGFGDCLVSLEPAALETGPAAVLI
jgi:anti-anti-sigma factor